MRKLDSLFDNIVTKAAIDFSDKTIQDFQVSVLNMLNRARMFINQKNYRNLKISKIVPCGSMAEKKCIWKLSDIVPGLTFIECDFLAVLRRHVGITIEPGCSECMYVRFQPSSKKVAVFCNGGCPQYILEDLNGRLRHELDDFLNTKCFRIDIINTFSNMYFEQDGRIWYTTDNVFTVLENELYTDAILSFWQTMPNSSRLNSDTSQLNVLIDFVPALELDNGNYIVAKPCTACLHGWRISGCKAEIKRLKCITDQQTKCYQVLKYFYQLPEVDGQNYHMKTAFLHHINSCSNTSSGVAKCVLEILRDIVDAYEKRQLSVFGKSSSRNLLKGPFSVSGWNEKGAHRLLTCLLKFENWEQLKTDLAINDCLDALTAFDRRMQSSDGERGHHRSDRVDRSRSTGASHYGNISVHKLKCSIIQLLLIVFLALITLVVYLTNNVKFKPSEQ